MTKTEQTTQHSNSKELVGPSNNPKEVRRKPVKTIAGVTPLTVVLKPRKCDHGTCIYCPGGDHVPQSYTDKSPAVMRALDVQFDPVRQVQVRLKAFEYMGHPTDKIELIILGGTFLQYEKDYQYEFVKACYDSLNGTTSETLEEAQVMNETAQHRIVALCIENRPDNCREEEIELMLSYGCTRVEIGVQMIDDENYKLTNRGHTVQDVKDATARLRAAGFKIGYHVMPGLPGSTPEKDLTLFKELFESADYKPDQLKLYPCQIIKDSPLEKTHEFLKFTPYDEETTKKVLAEMTKMIPPYCRTMRMMREIPQSHMVKGLKRIDLRFEVEKQLRKEGEKVEEIRMREIGFNKQFGDVSGDVSISVMEYEAAGGTEYFMQLVNKENVLFGLLRLRLGNEAFIDALKDAAIVREVHVYGQALTLGEKGKSGGQHTGYGRLLMEAAEALSKENGYARIAVISGVGVREYYRKLGYVRDGRYMVKCL